MYRFIALVTCQVFGLLPVNGVSNFTDNLNMTSTSFQWCSFRVILSVFYMSLGTFDICLYLYRLYHTGITAKNLGKSST